MATQALMHFAPPIAAELWELLGSTESLTTKPYPEVDPQYLVEDVVTYVIQVNGKVRGRFELQKGLSQEEVLSHAKADPNVSRFIVDTQIKKVIYVPNKLLNLVI